MRLLARLRIWLARGVALAAALAAAQGAFEALAESRRMFRYGRRHAGETLAAAQDRLFGREYMESVRAVRARFEERDTVRFVEPPELDGSSFFALFHLAPRRLVQFGRTGDELRRGGAGQKVRFVVVIPPGRRPLEIADLGERRTDTKRDREARP